MAITGTGVVDDPYVVHSYDEIKTSFERRDLCPITSNRLYIKLDNDIDCKNYGIDWTWTVCTFTSSNNADRFIFDLDGHTIKNFKVSTNSYMFHGGASGYEKSNFIKNGIIKNVYLLNADGLFEYGITFENVGISVNATGINNKNLCVPNIKFKRCGINLTWFNPIGSSNHIQSWGAKGGARAQAIYEYCDFMLNITNLYTVLHYCDYEDYPFKDCRFRGKISSSISMSSGEMVFSRGGMRNCIVDVDFSDFNPTSATQVSRSGSLNIVNTDTFTEKLTTTATIPATGTQIKTGDWLRAQGFPVVNVQTP